MQVLNINGEGMHWEQVVPGGYQVCWGCRPTVIVTHAMVPAIRDLIAFVRS
jgi:hypothetical protein